MKQVIKKKTALYSLQHVKKHQFKFSVPVCSSLRGAGELKPLCTLAVSAGGQYGSERNTDTRQINESGRHETT